MLTTLKQRASAWLIDPLQSLSSELSSESLWKSHGVRIMGPLTIWEEDTSVNIAMDVPGLTREDLELHIHKGRLTIKGRRKPPTASTNTIHEERRFGEFERSILLDDNIDPTRAHATLRDGILQIQFAKRPSIHHRQGHSKTRNPPGGDPRQTDGESSEPPS